jgi:hypothetical protein
MNVFTLRPKKVRQAGIRQFVSGRGVRASVVAEGGSSTPEYRGRQCLGIAVDLGMARDRRGALGAAVGADAEVAGQRRLWQTARSGMNAGFGHGGRIS